MKTIITGFCALLSYAAVVWAQDKADELDMQAHAAFDAYKFDTAIQCWTAELKINAHDATVFFNRAAAYEENHQSAKAIQDYGMAIQYFPGDAEAYEHRAKIYANRAEMVTGNDQQGDDKEDWDQAIADYDAAFAIRIKSEADPKAWLKKRATSTTKDYNCAVCAACLDTMIKLNPKDAEAWFHRSVYDPCVSNPGRVAKDLDEALRLDPTNEAAYEKRAQLDKEKPGGTALAIADYTAAIKTNTDPNKKSYLLMDRGYLHVDAKEYDKAIEDYNSAIEAGATGQGEGALADLYEDKGEWDRAEEYYKKFVREQDESPSYCYRAKFYYRRKDWDKAIADLSHAMEMDKASDAKEEGTAESSVSAELIMRGDLWALKGAYEKALADYRAAGADTSEVWLLLTCPEPKLRDLPGALKMAAKSCASTGWVKPVALDALAAAEAATGKWDDAITHEKMAIMVAGDEDEREIGPALKKEIRDYNDRLALYGKKRTWSGIMQLGRWEDED